MGVIHESLPVAALYNNPQQLILAAGGAVALLGTATKAIEVVHQGETGIKMQRGQPIERKKISEDEIDKIGRYVTLGPGIYPVVPLLQKVVKINVKDRTDRVQAFNIESKDGQLFNVNPIFTWAILPNGDNPYKALFEVNNEKDNKDNEKILELKQTVLGISIGGLGKVLSGRTSSDLIEIDRREVNAATIEECRNELLEYGAALKRVVLEPITRTGAEVLKQGIERGGISSLGAVAVAAVVAEEADSAQIIHLTQPNDAA